MKELVPPTKLQSTIGGCQPFHDTLVRPDENQRRSSEYKVEKQCHLRKWEKKEVLQMSLDLAE
jgi:hypothetical protein